LIGGEVWLYFHEFNRYEVKPWYLALRGLINVLLGTSIYLRPDLASDFIMQIFGAWLIVNNMIQMGPFFVRHRTRRLLPEALSTSLIGITVGVLALIKTVTAIEIATLIVGLLLLFRAVIELRVLVESRMRVLHQRRLLVWVIFSFVFGFYLILNPFGEMHFLEKTFGVYAVILGLNHIMTSSRLSARIENLKEETHVEESRSYKVPVENFDALSLSKGQSHENPSSWESIRPGDILNPSKYQRPIVVAAHPDDLEAFAGGLVFELGGVVSVIFSGGDKGVWDSKYKNLDKADYINLRLAEAAEAGRLLRVKEIIYMDYSDRGIEVNEENVEKIIAIFDHFNPDLVISFEYRARATLDPHPDHLAVGEITRQAVIKYRQNNGLDYVLMSSLLPNIFVNVSDVRRVKVEALSKHETQISFNGIVFPFLEKLITKIWGAYLNIDYAEGYRVYDFDS
jgi:LmbE family N-acetylglucosaminyl deacetylase/uncharacterized membrane protein HdeD (DUF308 family)